MADDADGLWHRFQLELTCEAMPPPAPDGAAAALEWCPAPAPCAAPRLKTFWVRSHRKLWMFRQTETYNTSDDWPVVGCATRLQKTLHHAYVQGMPFGDCSFNVSALIPGVPTPARCVSRDGDDWTNFNVTLLARSGLPDPKEEEEQTGEGARGIPPLCDDCVTPADMNATASEKDPEGKTLLDGVLQNWIMIVLIMTGCVPFAIIEAIILMRRRRAAYARLREDDDVQLKP